jgi:iron complex transport system substrate-binding protein
MKQMRWMILGLLVALAPACKDDAAEQPATAETATTAEAGEAEGGEGAAAAAKGEDAKTASKLGDKIVVGSGPFTELVFALGHGDRVTAVDTSSIYPPEAAKLPKIGFFRKLAPEPILAVEPSALILGESAGPESAIERVKATDVHVEVLEEPEDFDEARKSMKDLAALLGTPDAADPLITKLDADLEKAEAAAKAFEGKRALFIYARGPNVLMVAGSDTSAAAMLERAGLTNAAVDIEGFKPMTPEAVIAAKPDVLVMTEKGAKSVGGWKGISGLPGVAETPAAKGESLATVDDLAFLSYGPRTGEAILSLQEQLKELFDGA